MGFPEDRQSVGCLVLHDGPCPGYPNWPIDEAADIERQADAPMASAHHPCAGCGAWLVAGNRIHHFRESCTAYPQESECGR